MRGRGGRGRNDPLLGPCKKKWILKQINDKTIVKLDIYPNLLLFIDSDSLEIYL